MTTAQDLAQPRSAHGHEHVSDSLSAGMISARLDRLPATRTMWKFVVLLSLGFFFELYDLLYSGYVAPGMVKSGILTSTTVGLFGMTGVASFHRVAVPRAFHRHDCCGFLADRFGRRAIFTYSLLFYTAANVIMAFQDTAGGLNFWRFMAGLGIGVELVTIGTYISELVPKQIRGRAFACEQAVGFVAVPVVAFLSYLLVPNKPFGLDGWRWVVLSVRMARCSCGSFAGRCPKARDGWRKKGGSRKRTGDVEAGSEGRERVWPAVPAAGGAEAGQHRRTFSRHVGRAVRQARHHDDHLQRLPDGRFLRLRQLGADAAHSIRASRSQPACCILRSLPLPRRSGR